MEETAEREQPHFCVFVWADIKCNRRDEKAKE